MDRVVRMEGESVGMGRRGKLGAGRNLLEFVDDVELSVEL